MNRPAEYLFPTTAAEAVQMLAQWNGQARLVAGGTDLMLDLNKNKIQPRCLIGTDRIAGLGDITVEDGHIILGAAVTFAQIKDHTYIRQHVHALAEAAASVGSLSIQNQATLAGNIVNAMPAADGAIAAVALQAEVKIVDACGEEWHAVETLFLGPGQSRVDPTRQLVTHIRFNRHPEHWGTAWQRLGRRPSLTLPILNCAVSIVLEEDGRSIQQARIALGPVAPRPFRAHKAEEFLTGRLATDETLKQAAQIAQSETDPRGNVLRASRQYRLAAIPALVENALRQAVQRAA